ncbi:RICIN domain-containing protein [Actinosynnema sp. CA-299493]
MMSVQKTFVRLAVGFLAAVTAIVMFSPASQAASSTEAVDTAIAKIAESGLRTIKRTTQDPAALAYSQVSNAYTARCLAVQGTNAPAFQINCTPAYADQKWEAQAAGTDVFRIRNQYSGQCLAVQGSNNVNGAPAFQAPCASYQDQLWVIVDAYSGSTYIGSYLLNYYTGRALSVQGSNNVNGAPVYQYDAAGYGDQRWYGI